MQRRHFLSSCLRTAAGACLPGVLPAQATPPPNIILIYADDLGFGDIAPYGSRIDTANLTRMSREGALFRQFCASPVCSASRAALMTGRYGVRSGVPGVLSPSDSIGMALSETTMASVLRQAGYRTACYGKWHLGAMPQYLPTARGFDEYFGIPYSNDQGPSVLLEGARVVESPVDLETVTQRYTERAVDFIQRAKQSPFFLYMPHTAPHVPLACSRAFKGKSHAGAYGDEILELDWSVGEILKAVADNGLDSNTLVVFSSDNGPWFQGSAGRLRGRKGETFEGGLRVPFLARFPGRIPAGRYVPGFASTLDLLPTFAALASAPLPETLLDGVDIWPMLTGTANEVDRPTYLYFNGWNLQCARQGRWKLHVSRFNGPAFTPPPAGGRLNLALLSPELYDLETDPGESYNIAEENPRIVADIRARVEANLPSLPREVRDAWRDTLLRRTDPVNAGEWPTLKT